MHISMEILDSDSQFMKVKYLRKPFRGKYSEVWCIMLMIEKISDTCVSTIDMDKREVCLEGHEEPFHYEKDSLALLLQKAMTRKATFITKDGVIDWIELEKSIPTNAYTEVLKKSERMFLDLAENSPNMIFMSQKNGLFYVNKRCEEILGYKKEEFFSPDFDDSILFDLKSVAKARSVHTKLVKGEEVDPVEFEMVTKEGKKIYAMLTPKSIEFEGEPTYLGIATDITEHKKTEEVFSEIDEKYHSLVNNVPVDVWTLDNKDNPIFLNPNVEKMFGLTPEEIRQKGNWFWHERTHPEDRERVTEEYNRFFAKRKTGDVEYRVQRKDGTWIWIHDRILKVYEKDGELYADGITWEIIQPKKTEKTLSALL